MLHSEAFFSSIKGMEWIKEWMVLDGSKALPRSNTHHFTSAEGFWILFHQTTESFASCSQSFTSFDKLQAADIWCFQGWLTMGFIWRTPLFVSWKVNLSWLKLAVAWSWDSWLPSWSLSFLASCSVWSKNSSKRSRAGHKHASKRKLRAGEEGATLNV